MTLNFKFSFLQKEFQLGGGGGGGGGKEERGTWNTVNDLGLRNNLIIFAQVDGLWEKKIICWLKLFLLFYGQMHFAD